MDGWLKPGGAMIDAEDRLRLMLDEELRSGARIKVVGVGGGGGNAALLRERADQLARRGWARIR